MTQPYTMTTACADSVDIAMSAVGAAHNQAKAANLPILARLEEISHALQSVNADLGMLLNQERQMIRDAATQAAPGIPVAIANMLVNLHPQERIALDAAVRHGSLDPSTKNDRHACESLFRKGVFRFDAQNRFVIEEKYAPWVKRAATPHEILAALPTHLRELVRVLAARGGKIHVQPDCQYERSYDELRNRGILVADGALDKFRIADPFKDIAA